MQGHYNAKTISLFFSVSLIVTNGSEDGTDCFRCSSNQRPLGQNFNYFISFLLRIAFWGVINLNFGTLSYSKFYFYQHFFQKKLRNI